MAELFKVAIVAAMEREIRPLIKNWPSGRREFEGRRFKFYEKDGKAAVCSGIGPEAARRAAEAIIGLYDPELIISAGFAGGLDPALKVGQVLRPRFVIDAADSSRADLGLGEGVLVTFGSVADAKQKAKLAEAYGAQLVDMEAAAVARSAQAHDIRFLACKVVSDTSDSSMPAMEGFIEPDGRFREVGFAAHVAIRPWLWKSVMRLARDGRIATAKLCDALAGMTEAGNREVAMASFK